MVCQWAPAGLLDHGNHNKKDYKYNMAKRDSLRYGNRGLIDNVYPQYARFLNRRGRFGIRQYSTPILRRINYADLEHMNTISHIWTIGDRYYKLAHYYYGNSTVWWVIAYLNHKPTEAHCTLGDTIRIYMPLRDILSYLGVY